jgi:hypothetical protein
MNSQNDNDDTKSTEVIAARKDFPMLKDSTSMQKVLARIDETLGGHVFSPRMLSRIKVPSGDDHDFKLETPSGVERRSSIIGTIVAFRAARAYWKKAYGIGRVGPPDCSSRDGFIGEGDPGGDCPTCPLAAFNTARAADGSAGPGQACKELREMLVLLPGQILPHLLAVPPTSLSNFTKYSFNLLSASMDYWAVTTKLTLEPATSTGGIHYARIRFQLHSTMPEKEALAFSPYHERMRDLLKPMTMDTTAYEITGAGVPAEPGPYREPDETRPPAADNDDVPF